MLEWTVESPMFVKGSLVAVVAAPGGSISGQLCVFDVAQRLHHRIFMMGVQRFLSTAVMIGGHSSPGHSDADLLGEATRDRVRIWCMRHAESENVIAGVSGSVPTAPLTPRGHRQADAAAQLLTSEPINAIYSSTALRARQTASHLARRLRNCQIATSSELTEVHIGSHDGAKASTTGRQVADVLRAWIVEGQLERRVFDGETGQQVLDRMTTALNSISKTHGDETVALVGHVASLSVATGSLCNIGAQIWGNPLPHGQPFLIEWDGHAWHCPAWPGAQK